MAAVRSPRLAPLALGLICTAAAPVAHADLSFPRAPASVGRCAESGLADRRRIAAATAKSEFRAAEAFYQQAIDGPEPLGKSPGRLALLLESLHGFERLLYGRSPENWSHAAALRALALLALLRSEHLLGRIACPCEIARLGDGACDEYLRALDRAAAAAPSTVNCEPALQRLLAARAPTAPLACPIIDQLPTYPPPNPDPELKEVVEHLAEGR